MDRHGMGRSTWACVLRISLWTLGQVTGVMAAEGTVEFTCGTKVNKNLFWDSSPVLFLCTVNRGTSQLDGLDWQFRVEDLYYGREVWSDHVSILATAAGASAEQSYTIREIPYGAFRVHWRLMCRGNELKHGTFDISKMMPVCYRNSPESVRAYERRWGLFGGVFGFYAPELASDMGTRWNRYEDTVWSGYERQPGKYEMASLVQRLKVWKSVGIESIVFQTLYQRPEFRNPDRPDFAPAYGQVMRQAAITARGLANCFELGNEDNGPTKMLYAEVARQAASGIRSVQPDALIANSGTAYIDLGWLEMQAGRGVYDVIDVLCTHPYTSDGSPESWTILERLGQVDALMDRLGGMKIQWTTEFGWHHDFNPQRRAEWIPRHHIIGAIAGIDRHGLYTWERDFGVFQGTAQPSAVSVHALMKMIEGHRFAGLLRHDDTLWACVFERAGVPLAIAWSPKGGCDWQVDVTPQGRAFDLFGNPITAGTPSGRWALQVGFSPVYVTGIAPSVLDAAVKNECLRQHARFVKCVEASGLPPQSIWLGLSGKPNASGNDLRAVLMAALEAASKGDARPDGTAGAAAEFVKRGEQAVIAQALRWYWTAGRFGASEQSASSSERWDEERRTLRERLAASVAADRDIPSLRYVLERWDRLVDEYRVAAELKADGHARRLLNMQEVFAAAARKLADVGERVFFSMWPYLYTTAADGTLVERLRFVPGEQTAVRVRVTSYSGAARQVDVRLAMPQEWKTSPEAVRLEVPAGGSAEGTLRVICPAGASMEKVILHAVLRSGDLPARTVPFDDIVVEAPLRVTIAPARGLLPQTPLELTVRNMASAPLSGLVRLTRRGDGRALARLGFEELVPDKPVTSELMLRPIPPLPFNEWPLVAEFVLRNGRRVERLEVVDFACAVRTSSPPTIDGDLAEWSGAAPLHLDREEYGKGSFGGKWSSTDLSAVTYVMWDDQCLYFAARVVDQTFNQNLAGTSAWVQDSIQFSLAREADQPQTQLGLAMTPKGDEVVDYAAPASSPWVPGARLKVKVYQGGATYEAAIPWKVIKGLEAPRAGQTVRFSVLVNDDDAIMGRRFLERYGGIAHDKDAAKFGYLTLLSQTGVASQPAEKATTVLVEDFEEYPAGTVPDAWDSVVHLPPVPDSRVVAGAGRGGSKALVLRNSEGTKPSVYRNLVRPLGEVRPGEDYEIRCWMRGRGVEGTGGVIGVCSDRWGNESFSYLEHGTVSDEWKEHTLRFGGPTGGRLNLIVRNMQKAEELAIDEIRVIRVK